jgi:hypothetical protein
MDKEENTRHSRATLAYIKYLQGKEVDVEVSDQDESLFKIYGKWYRLGNALPDQ